MRSLVFLALAASLLVPSTAFAATVWGQISFWDNRADRGSGSSNHRLDPLGSNKNVPLPNGYVYLYDRDGDCEDFRSWCNETDDDYLASDIADVNGYYFFHNIGTAEDAYLVSRYQAYWNGYLEVRGMSFGNPIQIVEVGITHFEIGGDIRIDFNLTCPIYGEIGGCPSQTYVDENQAFPEARSNILASMVDVARWGGALQYNGHTTVYGYYPDGPVSGACSNKAGFTTGWSEFCISTLNGLENQVVGHEMGHIVMKRLLNDGSGSLGVSPCAGWGALSSEKCATSEGWAEFYSSAVYWTPSASDAFLDAENPTFNLEGNTTAGNGGSSQSCVWISQSPSRARGNVARWFWDLYDSTTVGDSGSDNATYSLSYLKGIWDQFPNGTANRKARESGDDGRNAYDFTYYDNGFQSELYQNCLTAMDTN